VKRELLVIAFAAAFPLTSMAARLDIGAAVSKESDSSASAGAAGSGSVETAGDSSRSADLQQRGTPKGDVKVKPRRELQTPRPPREVSVPSGPSGSIEGSGAIR